MRRILLVFAVMAVVAAIVAVSVTPAFARSNPGSVPPGDGYGKQNACYSKAYFHAPQCP